jgi:hypothetical protein
LPKRLSSRAKAPRTASGSRKRLGGLVRRDRRPALFSGYVVEDGIRRRLRKAELAEAWRLWCRHSDIRLGRVKA